MDEITLAQLLSGLAALGGAQWLVTYIYKAFTKAQDMNDRLSHLEHRMEKGEKMDELLLRAIKSLLPPDNDLVKEIDNFLISNIQDHQEV